MVKEAIDIGNELGNALKTAQPDDFSSNLPKEALDQIEPGSRCWGKMEVNALFAGQPSFDGWMFVRGVVVANDVDRLVSRNAAIDLFQEGKPLVVAMPTGRVSQNLAAEIVECGKERYRSVPIVVMGACANVTLPERQAGLSALQGLALALFITTEDDCVMGRVQIKADHVPVFFFKLQIVRQLEASHPVWSNALRCPQSLDRGFAQAGMGCHLPHTPRSAVLSASRSQAQGFAHGLGRNARLSASPRRILQARESLATPATSPLTYRRHTRLELLCNFLRSFPGRQSQDDPGTLRLAL